MRALVGKAILWFVMAAAATVAQTPAPPRPAPEFKLHQLQAPDLKLSSYKGKVVAIAFLNTGCEHCQHFAGELNQLEKEYGPKGVQVLAVVFDDGAAAGLKTFRDRFVKGYPLGYSDSLTVYNWLKQPPEEGAFVPIIAFVDRRGYIVSQHLGDDMLFQDPDANIRHKLDAILKRPR